MASIGPLPNQAKPVYYLIGSDGPIDVFCEASSLQTSECVGVDCHEKEKRVQQAFLKSECLLPEVGAPPMIRFRFECTGRELGKCGLMAVQYDVHGDPVI